MVVLIENRNHEITWYTNKWVSFKFFEDALLFLEEDSKLKKEIKMLVEFKLDLLNLTDFQDSIQEFKVILNKVIGFNEEKQGKDMYDPNFFQVYYNKLLELKQMFYEAYDFDLENDD